MNDKTDDAMEETHNKHMRDVLNHFIYENLTHLLPFNSKICGGIEFRFESIFKKPKDENKFHSRLVLRYSDIEIKHILNNYIISNYRVKDNVKPKKIKFIGHIKEIICELIDDWDNPFNRPLKFDKLTIMSNQQEFPDVSEIEYAEKLSHRENTFKAKKYKITLEELEDE